MTGSENELCAHLECQLSQLAPDQLFSRATPRDYAKDTWFVFARWGNGKRLVNVHLDTVPVSGQWSKEPFAVEKAGELIYGLGVADVKGALGSVLLALKKLRLTDVSVLFSGDEEMNSNSVASFLADGLAEGIELALVAEPTNCRAGVDHRGILYLDLAAGGPGGHSSLAPETAAPLLQVAKWVSYFSEYEFSFQTGEEDLCFNVGELTGGSSYNVIPTEGRAKVSLRPPAGVNCNRVADELAEKTAELFPEISLNRTLVQPSFYTKDYGAFQKLFGDLDVPAYSLDFWTEAAMLADVGINTIVCGPGDIEDAHKSDEKILVSEFESYYWIVSQYLTAAD